MVPNSKFVGHSTEIIRQRKIKGPLRKILTITPISVFNRLPLMSLILHINMSNITFSLPFKVNTTPHLKAFNRDVKASMGMATLYNRLTNV